ncbi:MAG TPA: TIGR03986 family CRISPR-associated RAMP protein [Kiritimatiellia bacterium]|nr:TIGR03986 family CRISPR-associated RAMP protein [Kiritimatiellia bacterium]
MNEFHNVYHGVPLAERKPVDTPFALPEHVTHDRYVPGAFSGELSCKITVETPTLCGNRIEDRREWTKLIHPSEHNGKPIIRGSALRGMISSVAEAASNSALRVLKDDRVFSYRRTLEEGLTALGVIVERNKSLCLYPLTSPHRRAEAGTDIDKMEKWQRLPVKKGGDYNKMFHGERLKVSFGDQNGIKDDGFLDTYKSFSSLDKGPFYALRRNVRLANHIKTRDGMCVFLGSLAGEGEIQPWDDNLHNENTHIHGVLRVFGAADRRLPNKKHEYFLPISRNEIKALLDETAIVFPIQGVAIERFNELAHERAEDNNDKDSKVRHLLPYGLEGVARGKAEDRSWKLKHGDLVYFRPSEDGNEVAEVSISSVWRDRVEENASHPSAKADVRTFLEKQGMAELLPWQKGRTTLTPAELLFGVVSRNKQPDGGLAALAGRVYISTATMVEKTGHQPWIKPDDLLTADQKVAKQRSGKPDVPFQNLASPKPPCPAFYFRPIGDHGYIPKGELDPIKHTFQGRKFYLRRPCDDARDKGHIHYVGGENAFVIPAKMADDRNYRAIAKQHQTPAKFINYDTDLRFHIRFKNLSPEEMNLLVYALTPTDAFRHQIGHAKPFGFGQIRVEIESVQLVDRRMRYTKNGVTADRGNQALSETSIKVWVESRRSQHRDWAEANGFEVITKALECIGDPAQVMHAVHYPRMQGQPPDDRSFKWFVENQQRRKFLAPLVYPRGQRVAVPALPLFEGPPPRDGGAAPRGRDFGQRRGIHSNREREARQENPSRHGHQLWDTVTGTFQPSDRPDFGGVVLENGERVFLHVSNTPASRLPSPNANVRIKLIPPKDPRKHPYQATMKDVPQP